METLGQKQRRFTRLLGQLINWAYANGYELATEEGYRTPEQASWNAAKGSGIRSSLHELKLAHDFSLFIKGVYQPHSEAYRPLGEYWKSLAPDCRWGGDFLDSEGKPKPDGDHFSIEHNGVK